MSTRKTKAPAAPTAADVLAAAGRAHAAAVAALRAVQLPDEADALEAAGLDFVANGAATKVAQRAISRMLRVLDAPLMGMHDDWLSRRDMAERLDSWDDVVRQVLLDEQSARGLRHRLLSGRLEAARDAVENAHSPLWVLNDVKDSPEHQPFWYERALRCCLSALECARSAIAVPVVLRRAYVEEGADGLCVERNGEVEHFGDHGAATARWSALTGEPYRPHYVLPPIAPEVRL